MKLTLISIAALVMILPLARAEDLSEIARQRDHKIARESQDLKNLDTQITEFEADLAKEEKVSLDLQATETKLTKDGEKLAIDGHSMMALDKAYGIDVRQQKAACPESTTDADLAQRCGTWKAKLDKEQTSIRLIRKDWMERKDKFLNARTRLDKDQAANKKAIEHFKYSIPNMKAQRDRILGDLWQINADVKKCRDAILGSSEEHMHAVCGQMWDGNKAYPEFSPEPGTAKKP
jgi:hypothetical protein